MSYTFFDISSKKEAKIDLKNCTITGNSVVYEAKDGKLTKYSIINGKVDKSTAETVSRIELTSYQMSFIDYLKGNDGNSTLLDKKDLKNLTPEILEKEINAIYAQKGIYEVVAAKAEKREAEIKIDGDKKIGIKFEKEEGFLKKFWNRICTFFKSFKTNNKSLKIDTIPERTYTIQSGDRVIDIANKLGIPLSCLRIANPDIDLDTLSIGQVIRIPEWKTVETKAIETAEEVAEVTGFSKSFIENLKYSEGFSAKPYWDKVRYSVGYGHSGRILGKYIKGEENKEARIIMTKSNVNKIHLSEKDATHLLAQDLLARTAEAEAYFGEAFKKAPKSLQAGIVDIIYNAGIEKAFDDDNTKMIKSNLENKEYASAVKNLILYPNNTESYKRNCYRVISALEDFSLAKRKKILNSDEIKSYFDKVRSYLQEKNLPTEVEYIDEKIQNLLKN